ncbi:MAG: hypothetical protein HOV77_06540 [Hamadaea sp.]|uniref:anti-sigma factor family protein n=1 Tax=Hamadaea sp. TaxID=2024425 RepID=UPI0017C87A23|nr:zf-HC2 domain-containing protein [Hamadaea sp.]NUT18824.1 hypothetical protein [Hamadaea sp.]
MTDRPDCEGVRPLLAEVATGAATGPERAAVLLHTATCDACRTELAGLAKAADELLLLAPAHEPPTGFESAVLNRLHEARPARRTPMSKRSWTRHLAVVCAVLVAAVLTGAVVWQATATDRRLAAEHRQTLSVAGGRYLKALPILSSTGVRTGTVFLYQGEPSWLLVSLAGAPTDGEYRMTVIDRDGVAHPSGACQVRHGDAVEGYPLYRAVTEIARIQLDGPGGVHLEAHTA